MGSLLENQDWGRNAVEVEIHQCLQTQNDILLVEIDLQKQVSRQVGKVHYQERCGYSKDTDIKHPKLRFHC